MSDRMVSLIMPGRWMSGESGPFNETKDMVKFMCGDGDLAQLDLFPNSIDVFHDVDIKGGVVYYLTDKNYKGITKFSVHIDGKVSSNKVDLTKSADENIVIRFPELQRIADKVFPQGISHAINPSLRELVSSRNPYGYISDFFTKNNEGVEISELPIDEVYLIHGLLNTKRVVRYIAGDAPVKNIEGAKSYKVFLPRANGSGALGEVFSTPMLGTPMQICTDTFLQVGHFDNEQEAKALLKYIKTKFFRAMVGIKKIAVFNYKDAFTYVPTQDFKHNSDIDWSLSIPKIDQQLYAKYGLTEEEIAFIEEKIKPME